VRIEHAAPGVRRRAARLSCSFTAVGGRGGLAAAPSRPLRHRQTLDCANECGPNGSHGPRGLCLPPLGDITEELRYGNSLWTAPVTIEHRLGCPAVRLGAQKLCGALVDLGRHRGTPRLGYRWASRNQALLRTT
jgi:hypothetical protein